MPDRQNGLAAAQEQSFDPFHTGVDRFDEAGLLEGNGVGNADGAVLDDPVHDADVFGKAAAGGLESRGTADLFISGALGEGLVLAVETLAAWDVVEDHNPVAGAVVLHGVADGGDYAGGFVSEDARGRMGTGGDLLEVGAADAAGVNAEEHLTVGDLGYGDGFEADVVYATVDCGLHGRGDRMWMSLDREVSSHGHEVILDDVGGRFVSNQGDGVVEGNAGQGLCGGVQLRVNMGLRGRDARATLRLRRAWLARDC